MTHELKTIGWRKFHKGGARHHWRTRTHMQYCLSACGYSVPESKLDVDDTLAVCERCETWLSLYAIDDPAPPQK